MWLKARPLLKAKRQSFPQSPFNLREILHIVIVCYLGQGNKQMEESSGRYYCPQTLQAYTCSNTCRFCAGLFRAVWCWECSFNLTVTQSTFSEFDRDILRINVQDFFPFAVLPKLHAVHRHQFQRCFLKESTGFSLFTIKTLLSHHPKGGASIRQLSHHYCWSRCKIPSMNKAAFSTCC